MNDEIKKLASSFGRLGGTANFKAVGRAGMKRLSDLGAPGRKRYWENYRKEKALKEAEKNAVDSSSR